jgi:aryl-alcohol dehydrogenase-like predicted oxidoreductase
MDYRRLGRTNLQISAIALGTVELGLDYGIPSGDHHRPSLTEAEALLHQALDQGINFIDTARAYGESEAIIGQALHARRHEYVLATKVVLPQGIPDHELSRAITDSVTTSLRMLQTDVIDLIQIHSATTESIRRGTAAEALGSLRQDGLVRFIGATTYGEDASLAAIEDGRFDCLQIAYNLLDRRAEERVLTLAQAADIGIVVRSVLLKGVLTHRAAFLPPTLDEIRTAAAQLQELAAAHNIELPDLAYRYVLAHPAVSAALVGTARSAELDRAIRYARHTSVDPTLLALSRNIRIHDEHQLDPTTWQF